MRDSASLREFRLWSVALAGAFAMENCASKKRTPFIWQACRL